MEKALIRVALSLLLVLAASPIQSNLPASPIQTNDNACNPNEKGVPPQCFSGSHPVAECVCDGPSGPCHWVWRCVKDQ